MSHASLPEELWVEIEPLLPPDEGTWRVAGIAEGLNRL